MRERILFCIIIFALGTGLYIFQNYINTFFAFVALILVLTVYGIYLILATKHRKRKLLKNPKIINEDYKPFVSIMIPAHNEEKVITKTDMSINTAITM